MFVTRESLSHIYEKKYFCALLFVLGLFLSFLLLLLLPIYSQFDEALPYGVNTKEWVTIGMAESSGSLSKVSKNQLDQLGESALFNELLIYSELKVDIMIGSTVLPEVSVAFYSPHFFEKLGVVDLDGKLITESNTMIASKSFSRSFNQYSSGEPFIKLNNKELIDFNSITLKAFESFSRKSIDLWLPIELLVNFYDITFSSETPENIQLELKKLVMMNQPLYFAFAQISTDKIDAIQQKLDNIDSYQKASYSGKLAVYKGLILEPDWMLEIKKSIEFSIMIILVVFLLYLSGVVSFLLNILRKRASEVKIKVKLGANDTFILKQFIIDNTSFFLFPFLVALVLFFFNLDLINNTLKDLIFIKYFIFSYENSVKITLILSTIIFIFVAFVTIVIIKPLLNIDETSKIYRITLNYILKPFTLIIFTSAICSTMVFGAHVLKNYNLVINQKPEDSETTLFVEVKSNFSDMKYKVTTYSIQYDYFNEQKNSVIVYSSHPLDPNKMRLQASLQGENKSISIDVIESSTVTHLLGQDILVGSRERINLDEIAVNKTFVNDIGIRLDDAVGKKVNLKLPGGIAQKTIATVFGEEKESHYVLSKPTIIVNSLPLLGGSFYLLIEGDSKEGASRILAPILNRIGKDIVEITTIKRWDEALENFYGYEIKFTYASISCIATLTLICILGLYSLIQAYVRSQSKRLAVRETLGAQQLSLFFILVKNSLFEVLIGIGFSLFLVFNHLHLALDFLEYVDNVDIKFVALSVIITGTIYFSSLYISLFIWQKSCLSKSLN